jgi:hypothetical protein
MLEAHNPEIGQKEGPGLRAASALSLAPIHRSAWKRNSPKSTSTILYFTMLYSSCPSGQDSVSLPGLMHSSRHYILWCWIEMRDLATQLISRKAARSPYNSSLREERQMSQEQQLREQSAWNRFLNTPRVELDFEA